MHSVTSSCFQRAFVDLRSYVDGFLGVDDHSAREHMIFKRNHSYRVAAFSGCIARKSGLQEADVWLAKLIGIFHDVARFEQFKQYRTFRDAISFDHGDYGAGLLDGFETLAELDGSVVDVMRSAISFHNKKEIPADLSGYVLLQSHLIRDADKLDILSVTCRSIQNAGVFVPSIAAPEGNGVTPAVLSALSQRKPIDYNLVQSELDFLLVKIGWVYDLNFDASLALLHQRNLLSILKSPLPQTPELETQLQAIDAYVHERIVEKELVE